MTVSVFVKRLINGAEVTFNSEAATLAAALAMAQELAGADKLEAPQETKTVKKPSNADSGETKKSSPAPTEPETQSSSTKVEPVTYDQVKEAILAISSKSRDKAVALLARFGAKSGKDLTEEQFAGFHADALRVIAGEYDPTEASND